MAPAATRSCSRRQPRGIQAAGESGGGGANMAVLGLGMGAAGNAVGGLQQPVAPPPAPPVDAPPAPTPTPRPPAGRPGGRRPGREAHPAEGDARPGSDHPGRLRRRQGQGARALVVIAVPPPPPPPGPAAPPSGRRHLRRRRSARGGSRATPTPPTTTGTVPAVTEPQVIRTDADAEDGLTKCARCGATEITPEPGDRDAAVRVLPVRVGRGPRPWRRTVSTGPIGELRGLVLGSGATTIESTDTGADVQVRCLRGRRRHRHEPQHPGALPLVPQRPVDEPADPQRRGAGHDAAVQPAQGDSGGEDQRVRQEAAVLRPPALQAGVRPRERHGRVPAVHGDRRQRARLDERDGRARAAPVHRQARATPAETRYDADGLPGGQGVRPARQRPDGRVLEQPPRPAGLGEHEQHHQLDHAVRHGQRGPLRRELPGGLHHGASRQQLRAAHAPRPRPGGGRRALPVQRDAPALRPGRALGPRAARRRRAALGVRLPAGVVVRLLRAPQRTAPRSCTTWRSTAGPARPWAPCPSTRPSCSPSRQWCR